MLRFILSKGPRSVVTWIAGLKPGLWQWHCLWCACDHEGEVLESFVTKIRDKNTALKFLIKAVREHGEPGSIVTDQFCSCSAALREVGAGKRRE